MLASSLPLSSASFPCLSFCTMDLGIDQIEEVSLEGWSSAMCELVNPRKDILSHCSLIHMLTIFTTILLLLENLIIV